ncbi:Endoglucanase 7 [Hordeum vulgare]|nr:Endoglucanase 7 [Hordeum vulgare]
MGKNAAAEDNVERSPGGMLYVRQWNNMQYVTSAAFLLSVYSGYLAEGGEGATPDTVTCAGGVSGEPAVQALHNDRAPAGSMNRPRGAHGRDDELVALVGI